MKISRLASRGVANLPDLECDLVSSSTGRPHDLVVVTGPPASGKTRLCELLLASLETVGGYQGIVRASDWYADAERGARVDLELWLDGDGPASVGRANAVVRFTRGGALREVERAVGREVARYDHDPAHGKREYFPEGRQRAWGARQDGLGSQEQALLRCSKDPQKYSFVPRFLAQLASDPTRRPSFARGLELLSPTARYVPTARGQDPTTCFSNRRGSGVPYAELSSSEADAVIIAATAALIGLNHSIVVLDRPELYVPPHRLVAWLDGLLHLGQDNQWFVATSSEALVGAASRSQVISLGGEA